METIYVQKYTSKIGDKILSLRPTSNLDNFNKIMFKLWIGCTNIEDLPVDFNQHGNLSILNIYSGGSFALEKHICLADFLGESIAFKVGFNREELLLIARDDFEKETDKFFELFNKKICNYGYNVTILKEEEKPIQV